MRPFFLDPNTGCKCAVTLSLGLIYPRGVPNNHWTGRWVGTRVCLVVLENRKFNFLLGNRAQNREAQSPVPVLTTLPQLQHNKKIDTREKRYVNLIEMSQDTYQWQPYFTKAIKFRDPQNPRFLLTSWSLSSYDRPSSLSCVDCAFFLQHARTRTHTSPTTSKTLTIPGQCAHKIHVQGRKGTQSRPQPSLQKLVSIKRN
jgi:hypothetical protein